jgi:hypothetical protein
MLNKTFWSTEQHIGERGLGGNDSESLPGWAWDAALGIAKVQD